MASVFTKTMPSGNEALYVDFRDVNGKQRSAPAHKLACFDTVARPITEPLANKLKAHGEARVLQGLPFFPSEIETRKAAGAGETFATLAELFCSSMSNRHARTDAMIVRRHLVPYFGPSQAPFEESIDLPAVMTWIYALRAVLPDGVTPDLAKRPTTSEGEPCVLSQPSQLNLVRMLSRFFTWAIETGKAKVNPVRSIPVGKRPKASAESTEGRAWIQTDAHVKAVYLAMPQPWRYMFYLCNRSGLRPGECVGLRISDLDRMHEGAILVARNYGGPLKEDKEGKGVTKWAPAPDDLVQVLAPWLEQRKREGAQPSDLLFPLLRTRSRKPPTFRAQHDQLRDYFEEARERVGLPKMRLYDSGRHSFASRNLVEGATLEETSEAMGHSSPVITQRYYNHVKRKTFSPTLRKGVGLGA